MRRLPPLLLLLACRPAPDSAPRGEPAEPAESAESADTAPPDSGRDTAPPRTPLLHFDGERPRNVLLVSLDTTRRDQIGAFTGLDTTPHLDALLADAVVLADHRSCSDWTAPSMLCALTGYLPADRGWWPSNVYEGWGPSPGIGWVPDDLPTLATHLRDAGYVTSLVTANGVFSPNFGGGIVNGYDTVDKPLWQPGPVVAEHGLAALSALQADGRPWLLHVHFIDPHGPYVAPEAYATDAATLGPFPWALDDGEDAARLIIGRWATMTPREQKQATDYLLTLYRAELRYWDESFAAFWDELDAAGALDDTLVVFWTDHGEQIADHGQFYHGVSLYDEENRSTAFFWARNLTPALWEGPTMHTDLAPTTLDALGLEPDPDVDGYIVGEAPVNRSRQTFNYIYTWDVPFITQIDGTYKLYYRWSGERYLYDLAADPGETHDRYDPDSAVVQAMWAELGPEVDRLYAQWPSLVPVDPGP